MDSAFETAAYPGYTTAELRAMLAKRPDHSPLLHELHRRECVMAGDMSAMTPGERIRFIRTGSAA